MDAAATTVDAFHRGRFVLVQPARGAHRAGMDAMVLAAALPDAFAGVAYDFGAGAGAVGLALTARCPGANAVLVESEPDMVRCAQATLGHAANAALAGRVRVLQADVALAGHARCAAGLDDRSADAVLMNPPFNDARDRAAASALRVRAHVMAPDMEERWLRSAAAVLKPGGIVALIARPASLASLLAALAGRFGDIELMALHPTPGQAAIRIVLRARRGRRGALSILPPLTLHEADGTAFTRQADAVINGRRPLFEG